MNEHYLRFLENEDEAQMTGYKFSVQGNRVIISQTFHHKEYEDTDRPKNYSVAQARKFWKELIDSGKFEEVVPSLDSVMSRIKSNGGFLSMADLRVVAKHDRLKMLLVRCGMGRFLAPAQDIKHFVDIIHRDRKDYVRDISLPAA
jgi:hypothetical protein